jgi:hypothetical protein
MRNEIGPKSWANERRFYDLDGDPIKNAKVVFHGRLKKTGDGLDPCDPEGPPAWFRVFCLSISEKRWVATCGMTTYIVELIYENE